eukprot:scaffold6058_cov96-Cylindrotheca_fusiformis.AAC.6
MSSSYHNLAQNYVNVTLTVMKTVDPAIHELILAEAVALHKKTVKHAVLVMRRETSEFPIYSRKSFEPFDKQPREYSTQNR